MGGMLLLLACGVYNLGLKAKILAQGCIRIVMAE
jgi:hypothetical protein